MGRKKIKNNYQFQIFHINFILVLNCNDYETNWENGCHLDETKRYNKRHSDSNHNQIKHSKRKMPDRPWYFNHTIGQHDLRKFKKKSNTDKTPITQQSTKNKNYSKTLEPKPTARRKMANKFQIPLKQGRAKNNTNQNVTEKGVSKKVARKKLATTVKTPRRLRSTKKKVARKVAKTGKAMTTPVPQRKKSRKFVPPRTTNKDKKVRSTTTRTVKKPKRVKFTTARRTKKPAKGKTNTSRTRTKFRKFKVTTARTRKRTTTEESKPFILLKYYIVK